MRSIRIPCDLWGWRNTFLVLAVLLAPLAALVGPVRSAGAVPTATIARTILVAGAALAAAALLYAHGRLAGNDQSRWVASALAISAVSGLALGGYALTHPDDVRRAAAVVLLVSIGVALCTLGLVLLAARPGLRAHPAAVAVPGGVVVLVVQQLLVTEAGGLPGHDLVPLLSVLVGVVNLLLAFAYLRLDALPPWVRRRFGAATILTAVSVSVGAPVSSSATEAVVALACGLVGGAVLASTAAALLRLVVQEEEHEVAVLQRRLHAIEAEMRADSARFHEINTMVAGIASANRLIADASGSGRQDGLITLVRAELDRLQRLLADRSAPKRAGRTDDLDLDAVIGRIVLAHRARGRDIVWRAGGLHARGRADHVAEILDVLIDNAALHAGPDRIVVGTRVVPGGVDIAVADSGPGVAPELRERIFDWGVHRPGSPGEGIGLYAAAMLALADGGDLRLDDTADGSRFVLHLQHPPVRADSRDVLAHAAP